MKKSSLWLAMAISFIASSIMAQNGVKVYIKRPVKPIFSFTKVYQEQKEKETLVGSNNIVLTVHDLYPIFGADYKDDSAQFTLCVNISGFGQGSDATYMVFVTRYKSDSVFLYEAGRPKIYGNNSPFYINVLGKEYVASLNMDSSYAIIKRYNGKPVESELRIYNDKLPASSFFLLGGKKASFADYTHKHKYIYVMYCDSGKSTEDQLAALKPVTKKYDKVLTNVLVELPLGGFDDYIKTHKMDEWVIADYWLGFPNPEMQISMMPNGALFDENGTIVNRGCLPSELGDILQNLTKTK